MTVTHERFKILSGHGFCIKCYCDLDLWPSDIKIYRVIYWPPHVSFMYSPANRSSSLFFGWFHFHFLLNQILFSNTHAAQMQYFDHQFTYWLFWIHPIMTVSNMCPFAGLFDFKSNNRRYTNIVNIRPLCTFLISQKSCATCVWYEI